MLFELPASAAMRYQWTASEASAVSTPRPCSYIHPSQSMPPRSPPAAALRNQRTASLSSFGTPLPDAYTKPALYMPEVETHAGFGLFLDRSELVRAYHFYGDVAANGVIVAAKHDAHRPPAELAGKFIRADPHG